MKSKRSKDLYTYIQKSIEFVLESGIYVTIAVFIVLILIVKNCGAQVEFSKIAAQERFTNNKIVIKVKNIQLVQRDEELDCTWKTSHAEIDGLVDVKTQNFLNDWLSGMTYFGNCEGDKECYDFQSYHYYYKVTRITFMRNNLLGFYLHEGNCKNENEYCLENQDWEIYDLRNKRFLQEGDIINQDEKSQQAFFALIAQKVKKQKHILVNDWTAYTRQIGLDRDNIVVYLNNDILNNTKGIVLRFKLNEMTNLLTSCFEASLLNKTCGKDILQIPIVLKNE